MQFAYADPPYYQQGKKHYAKFHPDAAKWDNKESHLGLINELMENYADGWALSCNPANLRWLLPACPETARVCVWAKSFHQIRPLASVQYAWEPVILVGGRQIPNRKPMVRDYLTAARTMRKGLIGAKPASFNVWILDLLGFDPEQDELTDLFPGTGGMAEVLKTYERYPVK